MAEELHKITPEELMKLYSDKSSFVLLAFSYLHDRDVAEDVFRRAFFTFWKTGTRSRLPMPDGIFPESS